MKLVHLAMAAAFLTSSFDLILVLNLGGTLRFAQLMLVFVILAACAQMLQSRTILWSRGATALAAWCIIQGLLLSQSRIPFMSFELYLVLIFSVVGIFATLQLY